MKKLEQWEFEKSQRQQLINQVRPTSTGKQTLAIYQTSQLMSTTFRFKNQTVATIVQYMASQEEKPTSVSQVLRFALEGFEAVVLAKYPELVVRSEAHAKHVLEQAGINTVNTRANRLRRDNNLTIESFEIESGQSSANQLSFVLSSEEQEMAKKISEGLGKPSHQSLDSIQAAFSEDKASSNSNGNDSGIPKGWPQAKPVPAPQVEAKQLVLQRDGTCKTVVKDRSKVGRKSVLLVCLRCKKPNHVLLGFTPESDLVPSNSCPYCEGITPHQIANQAQDGLEPMNISTKDFREQMLGGKQEEEK